MVCTWHHATRNTELSGTEGTSGGKTLFSFVQPETGRHDGQLAAAIGDSERPHGPTKNLLLRR